MSDPSGATNGDWDREDEHFPWNYTAYGVECICGSAMDTNEKCLGQA